MRFNPLFVVLIILTLVATDLMALDSLRVEQREGKKVVVHQVDQGETVYGLSRRYGIAVDELKQFNDLESNSLDIGQLLVIPLIEEVIAPIVPVAVDQRYHEVKPGETLYSLSRQYDIPVNQLREWNALSSNNLSIGQKLLLEPYENQEVSEIPTRSDTIMMDSVHSDTEVEVVEADSATVDPLKKTITEEVEIASTAKKYGNYDRRDTVNLNPDQIIEEGFAMKIENAPETRKYLALHREVPIGTIMRVRNQMNNQSIFVRVVGKLPDTGPNNNVLIRLTRQGFERLGAMDPKIPVEISYMKE